MSVLVGQAVHFTQLYMVSLPKLRKHVYYPYSISTAAEVIP